MYIKTTTERIYPDEPEIGSIEERELMEDDGEALALLITYMADQQECPTTFTAIDDYSEEDIELQTSDYLSNEDIDILNGMFIETDGWTEEQIAYILR